MSWVTITEPLTAGACLILLAMIVFAALNVSGRSLTQRRKRVAGLSLIVVIISVVACLVQVRTQAAQPTFRSDSEYLIDTWETEDGLPENSATAMAQTPDGYLWFGTWNGLVRFDGVKFVVFNSGNTPQLPNGGIANLHVDRHEQLWVSTLSGLVMRKGERWRTFGTNEGWAGDFVRTFAERPNGDLLLTTFDGHVLEFAGERLKELPHPPSPPHRGFFGAVDGAGLWWVTDRDFVGRWDGQRWIQAHVPDRSQSDPGVPSASARDGGVWILSGKELLKFQQGAEVLRVSLPQALGTVWSLSEDSRTNVWIGSYDAGLFRVDPNGSLQRWTTTNGLGNVGCRFVFEDRESDLWLGMSRGLTRFKPRRVRDLDRERLVPERMAKSIWPTRDGGMWVATYDQGLFRYDASGALPAGVPRPSTGHLMGFSVLEDQAGRVWYRGNDACWWLHGPAGFEKAPLTWAQDANGRALFEDSKGRIWISAWQGVALYDGKAFHEFGSEAGLPTGGVSSIGEDLVGVPWLATEKGVFRYDHDRFFEVTASDTAHIGEVTCFLADPDGAMWMGTKTRGLLRLRNGRLSVIGPPLGFPVETVHAMIADDRGYLWIPSNRGIVRASRRDLHAVADGARTHLDCQLLDRQDGLPSVDCSNSQPSCARDQSGRLWFATQRGVAMIDPAAFRLNTQPPPVLIEQVEYQLVSSASNSGSPPPSRRPGTEKIRRAAPFPEPLRLPPGSYGLTIDYAALSFRSPEKVRFQTRLEGSSLDWNESNGQRSAVFHQLRAGNYVFHVRAANDDGVWNEAGASLAFTVLPFYWQTVWFRTLGWLGLAAALFGTFYYRLNRVEKSRAAQLDFTRRLITSQENERKRVAAELHDGLGQNLLLIKNRLVMATARQADAVELGRQLEAATAATARAVAEVRAISHALRPAAIDQVGLTKAIAWMTEQLGETTPTTTFSTDLDNIDGLLAPEMEMTLFRILQEGLSNAIRHGSAAQIILEVKREEAAVRASLFDNGRGFDIEKLLAQPGSSRGLGLLGMRERVGYLGGSLNIQSTPGKGTRVTVLIPLKSAARES